LERENTQHFYKHRVLFPLFSERRRIPKGVPAISGNRKRNGKNTFIKDSYEMR
jgi:hypothetical protein